MDAAYAPDLAAPDRWAERSEFWASRGPKATRPYRATRERPRAPLVLSGHGMSLRVERGALVIKGGYTLFPHVRAEHRLFPGEPSLPPRIIVLDGKGSLSFDVLNWLAEQRIPLTRINWKGEAVSTMAASLTAFSPERIRWQEETAADPARRLAFCCDLIVEKLERSAETLRQALPPTAERNAALQTANDTGSRLQQRAVRDVSDVLLLEARAASAYFNAWRGLPLKWKGLARRPVPDRWLSADVRNASNGSGRVGNRHANHPVNAMLNYAYGVLYSAIQASLVSQGFDPTRGIMHVDRTDASAFVLDCMEVERARVDAGVLGFVNRAVFHADDFAIRADGVCRLSPQLAAEIVRVCETGDAEGRAVNGLDRCGPLPLCSRRPRSSSCAPVK